MIQLQGQGLIDRHRGCSTSQAGVRSIQDLNRFNLHSNHPKVSGTKRGGAVPYKAILGHGVSLT